MSLDLKTLLKQIPKGKVVTYKELAIALQMPKAWRYVGTMVSKNDEPIVVPCHRVVKSNGDIGNYTFKGASNPTKKRALLESEGVSFSSSGKVLKKYFHEF